MCTRTESLLSPFSQDILSMTSSNSAETTDPPTTPMADGKCSSRELIWQRSKTFPVIIKDFKCVSLLYPVCVSPPSLPALWLLLGLWQKFRVLVFFRTLPLSSLSWRPCSSSSGVSVGASAGAEEGAESVGLREWWEGLLSLLFVG